MIIRLWLLRVERVKGEVLRVRSLYRRLIGLGRIGNLALVLFEGYPTGLRCFQIEVWMGTFAQRYTISGQMRVDFSPARRQYFGDMLLKVYLDGLKSNYNRSMSR